VVNYDPRFTELNQLASLGAFLLAVSVLPLLYNMIVSWVNGPKAGDNPWKAKTLEWQVSSPPPAHNFDQPPVVTEGPYDYGEAPAGSLKPSPAAAGD